MRFQPWMLLAAGTVAVIAASVFAAVSLGGSDDPASADSTTPASTSTTRPATPGATEDPYPGPAPAMTAHITEIIPTHGGQMKQAGTRQISGRSGICAVVNYDGLPENNQWFRMAVDDREVTSELSILVRGTESQPEGATMCYAPKDGLTVGRHTAAVIVQNPRATEAVAQETVAWKFEIVE